MADLYLVLLHHPVYDKNGADRHHRRDQHGHPRHRALAPARTACGRFYVVTPVKALRELAARIIEHWETGYGGTYNVTRKDALALVVLTEDLDTRSSTSSATPATAPMLVVTSARTLRPTISYAGLRRLIAETERPLLVLFGTGWGLTEEVIARSDHLLPAVLGAGDYNHLSVRSAAAIILDRLCGRQEEIQEAHP